MLLLNPWDTHATAGLFIRYAFFSRPLAPTRHKIGANDERRRSSISLDAGRYAPPSLSFIVLTSFQGPPQPGNNPNNKQNTTPTKNRMPGRGSGQGQNRTRCGEPSKNPPSNVPKSCEAKKETPSTPTTNPSICNNLNRCVRAHTDHVQDDISFVLILDVSRLLPRYKHLLQMRLILMEFERTSSRCELSREGIMKLARGEYTLPEGL